MRVDPEELFNITVGIPGHRDHLQKIPEVVVRTWRHVGYVVHVERESSCGPLRFTHGKGVDSHHRLSRVVCPVPRPRIQLPGGIKTCLKCRDNLIIWRVDIDSIEPSNRGSKWDSGVEGLWVGNVSEDPRHTSCVVGVHCAGGTSHLGPRRWSRPLNLYGHKWVRR